MNHEKIKIKKTEKTKPVKAKTLHIKETINKRRYHRMESKELKDLRTQYGNDITGINKNSSSIEKRNARMLLKEIVKINNILAKRVRDSKKPRK